MIPSFFDTFIRSMLLYCLVYDIAITAKLLAERLQDGPMVCPGQRCWLEVMEVSQNRCTLNHPNHWTILVLKAMILGYAHLKKTTYYIHII